MYLQNNSSSWLNSKFKSLLPSLSTITFILLCIVWYISSAITNTLGKQVLTKFVYPLTLTWIQFIFVCFFAQTLVGGVQQLSVGVVKKVGPLSCFQIAGHVFSSLALTYIPVSFTHTIKVLHYTFILDF